MRLKGKRAKQRLLYGLILLGLLSGVGAVAIQRHRHSEAASAWKPSSASDQTKVVSKTLKLGAAAPLGPSYSVAVDKLTLYTDANGPLLVAQVKAKYLGKDKRNPRSDLVVGFLPPGSDAVGESACGTRLARMGQPPPAGKGAQTYTACIELPTSAVEGGTVFVEAENNRAFWRANHVTTEETSLALPATPPKPSAAPAAAPPAAPAISEKVRREQLHDIKKQLKKLKKFRKFLDEQIDAYKKVPDYKKKKLKKLKKARDNTDEAIDRFETLQKQLGG